MNARLAEIEQLGARVAAIGNGTPAMATDFIEQFDIRFEVLTDPQRISYRAAGLNRSLGLDPRGLYAAWGALRAGHIQGRTKGDPFQQGGLMVIAAGGELLWRHSDGRPGNHGDVDRVLDSLRPSTARAT
ncbi:MAG: peroxiredoxin-like family protein [Nannocystaceae bacterium]